MARKRILVGEFGRAQGLRGEIRIKSFTKDPMRIADYAPLASEDGARSFRILSARAHQGDVIVARIEGVNDRAAAEKLTRAKLYAERAALGVAALAEGEYLQADLVGLSAKGQDGEAIGRIVGVENYGAGDLLAIGFEGSTKVALLPFSDRFAPIIDIEGGFIVIDPPAGWDEE